MKKYFFIAALLFGCLTAKLADAKLVFTLA